MFITDDNLKYLKTIPDDTYHACITDPPYGMGIAEWDHNVPSVEIWREVYRTLRPGAFLLSFCSPQRYHRMAVAVEDAGFKPIDMIFWIITTKMAKINRLKPAHEPIMVAQKLIEGSIKNNLSKWGCGQINIDDNKISWQNDMPKDYPDGGYGRRTFGRGTIKNSESGKTLPDPKGRYPSNVMGLFDNPNHQKYFYAPRVTAKERGKGNTHPTPKPIDLMRYLCGVYAPKNGIVLDPFSGSGSTGLAAYLQGMDYVGIDKNEEYTKMAQIRWESVSKSNLKDFFPIETTNRPVVQGD